jgi:hypothetical protein
MGRLLDRNGDAGWALPVACAHRHGEQTAGGQASRDGGRPDVPTLDDAVASGGSGSRGTRADQGVCPTR